MPDWMEVHRQFSHKGVTLRLVWEEYKAVHPDGFQYTQFCVRYRAWRETLDLPMRQEHKAGEKLFVDYCGQTAPVTDRKTGEIREAQIYATAFASNAAVLSFRHDIPLLGLAIVKRHTTPCEGATLNGVPHY